MTRLSDTDPPVPPPVTIEDAVAEARQLIATAQQERAALREERCAWAAVQEEIGALRGELNALPEALGTGVQNGLTETVATLRTVTAELQAHNRAHAPRSSASPPPPPVFVAVFLLLLFSVALNVLVLTTNTPDSPSLRSLDPVPPPPRLDPIPPPRPQSPPPPARPPWSPRDLR